MIGLGCMRLSTDAEQDDARTLAVLEAALDSGVELLDTADAYAHDEHDIGHNERLIARAIASRRVTVVTKGGLERPAGAWVPNGRARHLDRAARASRDRLGVDAIDLYLLHVVDPRVPLATSVRALARLRDAGVVRRIGLSNVNAHQLEQALAITAIDAVEVELSPWKLDAIRGGLVAACEMRGIRVLAHRPLGGPAGARRLERDAVVSTLASNAGATPAELVLAWLRRLSPSITTLPGATRIDTARSAARDVAIDDTTRLELDARFLAIDPEQAAIGSSVRVVAVDAERAASGTRNAPFLAVDGEPAPASRPKRDARLLAVDEPAPASTVAAAAAPSGAALGGAREVVMIIGMPASGKSTLATDYAARGYLRLNRDELGGTLIQIARTLGRELRGGAQRVVLDNTYGTRAQRAAVVEVARKYGADVRCVVMATSIEQAQANAVTRMLERHGRLFAPHELGRDGTLRPGAQFKFRREYEPPRLDEGFVEIEEVPFVARLRESARSALVVEIEGVPYVPGPGESAPLALAVEIEGVPYAPGQRESARPALIVEPVPFVPRVRDSSRPALIVELDDLVWRGRPRVPGDVVVADEVRGRLRAWHEAGYVIAATTWSPDGAPADRLDARLREVVGVPLAIARCTHPAGPPVCWCRKPLPGLGLWLAHEHQLDLARSVHVGRGPADRGFALRVGVRFVDVAGGFPLPSAGG